MSTAPTATNAPTFGPVTGSVSPTGVVDGADVGLKLADVDGDGLADVGDGDTDGEADGLNVGLLLADGLGVGVLLADGDGVGLAVGHVWCHCPFLWQPVAAALAGTAPARTNARASSSAPIAGMMPGIRRIVRFLHIDSPARPGRPPDGIGLRPAPSTQGYPQPYPPVDNWRWPAVIRPWIGSPYPSVNRGYPYMDTKYRY